MNVWLFIIFYTYHSLQTRSSWSRWWAFWVGFKHGKEMVEELVPQWAHEIFCTCAWESSAKEVYSDPTCVFSMWSTLRKMFLGLQCKAASWSKLGGVGQDGVSREIWTQWKIRLHCSQCCFPPSRTPVPSSDVFPEMLHLLNFCLYKVQEPGREKLVTLVTYEDGLWHLFGIQKVSGSVPSISSYKER